MPSLAELRARSKKAKVKSRPTYVRRISLDQEVLADIQRLEEERQDLLVAVKREKPKDGKDAKPRKLAEGDHPRLSEIGDELEVLYDKLRESEGELRLRGVTGGEWQEWKDEHPPRKDNQSDSDVALGFCNATDLLNELGTFVESWEGEELADGDWEGWLRDDVAPGDLRQLVTDVVTMQERSGVRAPKATTSPETPSESSD